MTSGTLPRGPWNVPTQHVRKLMFSGAALWPLPPGSSEMRQLRLCGRLCPPGQGLSLGCGPQGEAGWPAQDATTSHRGRGASAGHAVPHTWCPLSPHSFRRKSPSRHTSPKMLFHRHSTERPELGSYPDFHLPSCGTPRSQALPAPRAEEVSQGLFPGVSRRQGLLPDRQPSSALGRLAAWSVSFNFRIPSFLLPPPRGSAGARPVPGGAPGSGNPAGQASAVSTLLQEKERGTKRIQRRADTRGRRSREM